MLEKVVCVDFPSLAELPVTAWKRKTSLLKNHVALFHFSTAVLIFLSSSSLSPLCLPFLRLRKTSVVLRQILVVISCAKLSVTSISQFPSLPSNNICSPALLPVWFGSLSVALSSLAQYVFLLPLMSPTDW